MRNAFVNEYAADWAVISRAVKDAAGWRCIRCQHPFGDLTGSPLNCDERCDISRGIHNTITIAGVEIVGCLTAAELIGRLNYGVHHFDGDKGNNRWWNLMALCNSCHLKIQATVIPERPWLFEHSEWAKPFIAGFYAWWFAKEEPTREAVEANLERFLALGQPWLYSTNTAS